LSAVYDYGQYGVELKNNIKKYWWDSMVLLHENIVGIDSQYSASNYLESFRPC
jgi:glycyl-tRNA synthetase